MASSPRITAMPAADRSTPVTTVARRAGLVVGLTVGLAGAAPMAGGRRRRGFNLLPGEEPGNVRSHTASVDGAFGRVTATGADTRGVKVAEVR